MFTQADLARARHELLTKGDSGIEHDVSHGWCVRALVAYALAEERRCPRWLHAAAGYAAEAREHAANVDDGGHWLSSVEAVLAPAREAAIVACGG
jgi:hypothetical protein